MPTLLEIFVVLAPLVLALSWAEHPTIQQEEMSKSMNEDYDYQPEFAGGYFEGDIVLDDLNRNALINPARKWPNNKVYYDYGANFSKTPSVYI